MGKCVTAIFILVFLAYNLLGAGIFMLLEESEEKQLRDDLFKVAEALGYGPDYCSKEPPANVANTTFGFHAIEDIVKERLTNLSTASREENMSKIVLTERELRALVCRITDVTEKAVKHGLDPHSTRNNSSPIDWGSLSGTLHFCMTVLTTIGYGHISPSSEAGRVFCVVYGFFGVPLTIAFVSLLGEGMRGIHDRAAAAALRGNHRWGPDATRRAIGALFIGLGSLLFIFVPSVIFSIGEGWSYVESLYYTFVTLSTIGFGDYVTGRQRGVKYHHAYQGFKGSWLYSGLAFVALVFFAMTQAVNEARKRMEKRIETRRVQSTRVAGPSGESKGSSRIQKENTAMPSVG
ncbi:potassium channel subfamily K member 16-like [Branchiostoma floridae]|uniref:Potassium channel subfamily K member 16-like n=1 Tax=Branchiostoma floridae TaxID=7739 RepID=A0A9J7HK13_BRAFL|nr:potassium channel subfamily K member 16-like [Branchiostoma floridae]